MKGYLELILIDLKLAFRNKGVLFFNYLFPLIFFFIFAEVFNARESGAMPQIVSMVLILGILGNGLWGQASAWFWSANNTSSGATRSRPSRPARSSFRRW